MTVSDLMELTLNSTVTKRLSLQEVCHDIGLARTLTPSTLAARY
jgi:hypothetical protein